eukprot:5970145-Heterocapsa_arctica.AAC.1
MAPKRKAPAADESSHGDEGQGDEDIAENKKTYINIYRQRRGRRGNRRGPGCSDLAVRGDVAAEGGCSEGQGEVGRCSEGQGEVGRGFAEGQGEGEVGGQAEGEVDGFVESEAEGEDE